MGGGPQDSDIREAAGVLRGLGMAAVALGFAAVAATLVITLGGQFIGGDAFAPSPSGPAAALVRTSG